MNKEDRDLKVMQRVAPKIKAQKLMTYQRTFTNTVREFTTMKKFRKMNKNRRFAIQVELFTKEFLASEATESDVKVFSDKLKELILAKIAKDYNYKKRK